MNDETQTIPLYFISNDVNTNVERKSSILKTTFHSLREHSGIWYMISSSITFTCATFVLKLIPADMFDIMIARFLVQTLFFGIYAVFLKHYNVFHTHGQPVASALHILMSCANNLTYLAAFYFLPLTDLNTIKYTYIAWTAILSVVFLKDRFKSSNAVALLFTFFGVIFATKPDILIRKISSLFNQPIIALNITTTSVPMNTSTTIMEVSSYGYYYGLGLAFLSAITKAIQIIARKQLIKEKQPSSVMNFHFTSTSLIVSIIYSAVRRIWQPEPYPWKWMCTAGVVIGLFQVLATIFYTKALKRENVQLIAILGSLDIIYAVILQYIFFRQTKSWIFYIGAFLIVISATILSVDRYLTIKRQRKRNNKQ